MVRVVYIYADLECDNSLVKIDEVVAAFVSQCDHFLHALGRYVLASLHKSIAFKTM